MKYLQYATGLSMKQFSHIPEISSYNHNYYIGLGKDFLFAHSDDDHTTEWYLVEHLQFTYLGESYGDKDEKLERYESKQC